MKCGMRYPWRPRRRRLFALAWLLTLAPLASADKYAVIVGIDVYDESAFSTLHGAANDARAIGRTLIDVIGFPRDHVRVLTSDRATPPTHDLIPSRVNILRQINWLVKVAKPGDVVLFYYAGHGTQLDRQSVLLPKDSPPLSDELAFSETVISADEVIKAFARLDGSLLLAVYDMCRDDPSSSMLHTRGTGRGVMGVLQAGAWTRSVLGGPHRENANLSGGSVRILACKPGEVSYESPAGGTREPRGYFSEFFERALKQAADGNGVLKVRYVVDAVKSLTGYLQAIGLGTQTPVATEDPDSVLGWELGHGLSKGAGSETVISLEIGRSASIPPARSIRAQSRYLAAFQTGSGLFQDGKYAEAEAKFREAAGAWKTSAVLDMIGTCRQRQGDYGAAHAFYEEAVELDPKFAQALTDLGAIYDFRLGNLAKAARLYRRAIRLQPGNPVAYSNLARVMGESGHARQALSLFLNAFHLSPAYPVFEGYLAFQLQRMGRPKSALAHARHAIALGLAQTPEGPDIISRLRLKA